MKILKLYQIIYKYCEDFVAPIPSTWTILYDFFYLFDTWKLWWKNNTSRIYCTAIVKKINFY